MVGAANWTISAPFFRVALVCASAASDDRCDFSSVPPNIFVKIVVFIRLHLLSRTYTSRHPTALDFESLRGADVMLISDLNHHCIREMRETYHLPAELSLTSPAQPHSPSGLDIKPDSAVFQPFDPGATLAEIIQVVGAVQCYVSAFCIVNRIIVDFLTRAYPQLRQ